jgi:hypothetical protein
MSGGAARSLLSACSRGALLTMPRGPSRHINTLRILAQQPIDQRSSWLSSRTQVIPSHGLSGRRQFSASASRFRDHHFDTLKFVQRLKEEGFTEEQAVAMMKVLSDVIEERSISPMGAAA